MRRRFWQLLLFALVGTALLFTGCSLSEPDAGNGNKVNVFTSQKFMPKDFVIQLANEEYLSLAREMIGNIEESGTCPAQTPDYILQFTPPDGKGDSDYWWMWTGKFGTVTLVHQSEDSTKAYRSTKVTSHQWGKMIEKATDGKGPV